MSTSTMSSRKPTGYLAVAADRPGDVGLAEPHRYERVLEFGVMQDRAEPPDPFGRHPLIPGCAFDVIEPIPQRRIALRCKRLGRYAKSPVVEILCGRSVSGVVSLTG